MKMRRLRALVASLAILTLVAGCGARTGDEGQQGSTGGPGGQQAAKQELVVNLGAEPPTMDPGLMEDHSSITVATNIFEGLTRLNPDGKYEAAMAESWETSEDGLVWTFKLRDGIKWSNGDPVTAHDFEFAWKRALAPEFGSPYAYQLYYLKNGEKYNKGEITDPDQVGVKALDDKTLQVTLEAPTPYFLSLTAFPTYYPVPKKVVEANPNWAAEAATLVGNGPFKIVEWVHNDKLVIVKNENYWDKDTVKLEKITFLMVPDGATNVTMFENGEVDVNLGAIPQADLPRLLASGDAKVTPQLGTYYYIVNTTKPPFNDVRVRKALSLAIDRKAIVENVTRAGELPAYAFVPPGIPDVSGDFRQNAGNYISEDMEANIAEAKRLLAEAGYPDGKGFPPAVILYNQEGAHQPVAEAIQAMWKQNLGITNITLQSQEWKVFLQTRHNLQYDIARNGWLGDYLDPMTFLDMFTSDSGQNDTGWKSKEYDELIATAKRSADPQVRMEAMHKAEKMLFDEAVVIPIYFYVNKFQEKPWVKGVLHPPIGAEDFKWAYVEAH